MRVTLRKKCEKRRRTPKMIMKRLPNILFQCNTPSCRLLEQMIHRNNAKAVHPCYMPSGVRVREKGEKG